MRNLGRALAAFTIWAAAALVYAQTPAVSPGSSRPTDDYSTGGEPAAGEPIVGDPIPAAPAADSSAASVPVPVAPMPVAPVSVAPTPSAAPVAAVPAGPPPMVAVPQAVYVADFIAVPAGAPPSGLLARLRAALHAHAAGREAGLMAQAVVQRLNHMGVAARYLRPGDPPPVQGWLIGGVFHVTGGIDTAASDDAASATQALGASVSVTVADLEYRADTPFAIIGTAPAASGEPAKWHPYVVPAALSFERADRNAAVADLARKIADALVENMTALRQADARAISP